MSDLQNPLFDEEKEFLERKKLEYERALRGDVDEIKEKSVQAGKVALVGAGLAGSIWLITKAFKGKSKKRKHARNEDYYDEGPDAEFDESEHYYSEGDGFADDDSNGDYEFGTGNFASGSGKRYKSTTPYKSAAESAEVFADQDQYNQQHEADNLGFDSAHAIGAFAEPSHSAAYNSEEFDDDSNGFNSNEFEDDPFQDLPYDDSRRLPTSHAFDDGQANGFNTNSSGPRSSLIGSVLQAFLQSDTGKVLVAQAAAVALAMVTKKVSEFFPAPKNSDLAASPEPVPVETGFLPVASLASPDSPDASTHSQSL